MRGRIVISIISYEEIYLDSNGDNGAMGILFV